MPKVRGGRTARILAACSKSEISTRGGLLPRRHRNYSQDKENEIKPRNNVMLKPFSTIVVESPVVVEKMPDGCFIPQTSSVAEPVTLGEQHGNQELVENIFFPAEYEEQQEQTYIKETARYVEPEGLREQTIELYDGNKGQQEQTENQEINYENTKVLQEQKEEMLSDQNEDLPDENIQDIMEDNAEKDPEYVPAEYFEREEQQEQTYIKETNYSLREQQECNQKMVENILISDEYVDPEGQQEKAIKLYDQNKGQQEETENQVKNHQSTKILQEQKEEMPSGQNEDLPVEIMQDIMEDNAEKDPEYVPGDTSGGSDTTDKDMSLDEEPYLSDTKPFSKKKVLTRKTNKNCGKKYKTAKGKEKNARRLKPLRPDCRNKCREKLDENVRQKIFDEYWNLGSHDRRVAFIASLITAQDTKVTRSKIDGRPTKNRLHTYIYTFEINGEKVYVCKSCFLATLDETEKFVTCTMANKMSSSSGVTHTDHRGTHTPIHKTAQHKIDEVVKHIKSFPAYESHYSRRHTNKKYLASNLNLNTMYKLYCEEHKFKPVSIKIYSREFHKMGLRFKKPKNDTCSKCDSYLAKEKYCEDEQEKIKIKEERNKHLDCAEMAYKAKNYDKEKGITDPTYVTYAFDLQQVLQTPYLTTNKMFYLRQLATYNLTIHNCTSGESSHYMWPECTAGRGANEISSCLYRHIMFNIPNGTKTAVFYSDTCGGQNKNSFVCSMFQYVIQQHPSLEVIDHKFLVPGYTHLECDVDHSVIERAKKKCNFDIHVPRDWYQLVRTASKKNKFKVEVMEQENFLAFSDLISKGPLQNKNKSFKLREVCWLRYTKKEVVVKYKCNLEEEEPFKHVTFFKKGQKLNNLKNFSLVRLYTSQRPISTKKKENLLEIVNLLDKDVQQYYHNLNVDKEIEKDVDPDLDRYLSEEDE